MILNVTPSENHIKEGDYFGKILTESESTDGKYLWLKIEIDEIILNISISANSPVLANFCKEIALAENIKDLSKFDTKFLVNKYVNLTLVDKEINSEIYSKIKSIRLNTEIEDVEFWPLQRNSEGKLANLII